ncbi:MAG: NUDIX hydrolase [Pseudanabaenaceae cyanobacterium]
MQHQVQFQRLYYRSRKFAYRVEALKLPNGAEGEYAYIDHPGAGVVVPMAPDGRFVLVRQYRFAVGAYLLEFPAGTLEPGEDPDRTIARELEEETGYHAQQWQYLGAFFLCPGYSTERIHAYLARNLSLLTVRPKGDEDEDLETVLYDRPQLEALLSGADPNALLDAKSIAAYHLAQRHLNAP